jgi:sRNA-binding protein
MSDARAEYESAIDRAISDCDATVTQAYQHMRSYCDQAWYTYCVRTGMVTVPRPETEGQDDDGEREAVARSDGQHGDSNGQPAAEF